MREYTGKLSSDGLKIAIITSRFNEFVTEKLFSGALDTLEQYGFLKEQIISIFVPGALEIPVATKLLIDNNSIDAAICLGAVIKGDTAHFDIVANQSASCIAQLALSSKIPIINGILTTNSVEEAIERAGSKAGNKGREAAVTAIEMANLSIFIKKEANDCNKNNVFV